MGLASIGLIGTANSPALTQRAIVERMGLSQGLWATDLTIEGASFVPAPGGDAAKATEAAKLREAVGRKFLNHDCVGRLGPANTIILPGVTAKEFQHASWSAERGKLNLTLGSSKKDGFTNTLMMTSDYTATTMHSVVRTRTVASYGTIEIRVRLESRFEGACPG